MKYRKFGNCGIEISHMGLGCYGMSGAYGAADDAQSIKAIHRAIELGVNLLDTSASYGQGHNHQIIGQAIRDRRDKVFIHSKTGTVRNAEGASVAEGSGTPERLREVCEISLKGLGIEVLDNLCMSRIDPTVPVEESVGAMARLVEEGKIRFISLSECSPDSVRRGSSVHPLTALQFEYSLWSRDPEGEHLAVCHEYDMAFMAYSPLGYGFLTGAFNEAGQGPEDRKRFPRFQDENFEHNAQLVADLGEVAAARGATAAQMCLAWLFAQDDIIFPIPGSKSITHLEENLAALEMELTNAELARLDEIFPPGAAAGTRYPASGMKRVNL